MDGKIRCCFTNLSCCGVGGGESSGGASVGSSRSKTSADKHLEEEPDHGGTGTTVSSESDRLLQHILLSSPPCTPPDDLVANIQRRLWHRMKADFSGGEPLDEEERHLCWMQQLVSSPVTPDLFVCKHWRDNLLWLIQLSGCEADERVLWDSVVSLINRRIKLAGLFSCMPEMYENLVVATILSLKLWEDAGPCSIDDCWRHGLICFAYTKCESKFLKILDYQLLDSSDTQQPPSDLASPPTDTTSTSSFDTCFASNTLCPVSESSTPISLHQQVHQQQVTIVNSHEKNNNNNNTTLITS